MPIAENGLNTRPKLTFLPITVPVRVLMVVGVFMILIIHFSHLESIFLEIQPTQQIT
ncbi:hypothetical protein SBF1_5980004 [Candidatus Desulfosporosinus infrequens]|uniref:Uncharacterized protein n=1 Tax=Candidatus Desulfosporosinus infrequens TaxID=2043169 RepID=A0A2U3LL85_9FIRM|nr:hypothetical protein SBF1_5980004 [Candidatus Desulfosporosinus infrequens]